MPHPGGWGWRRKLNYFLFQAPPGRAGSLTAGFQEISSLIIIIPDIYPGYVLFAIYTQILQLKKPEIVTSNPKYGV